MVNRFIRTLPITPTGNYTLEVIAQIKAIPNDDIKYTDEEIAWIYRALEHLNYFEIHTHDIVIYKTYPGENGIDEIFTARLWAAKDYAKLRREQVNEQLRIALRSRVSLPSN